MDIADFIEGSRERTLSLPFGHCTKHSGRGLSYLSYDMQEQIVKSITDQEIANIINELFVDDAADSGGDASGCVSGS